MRAAKQTLILCWIITIISLLGIVILHAEIDIWLQEQITKTEWTYDYDEREFYQGIWSNIFSGTIVSVFMTYVSYRQAKQDIEFKLYSNESIMTMYFDSLARGAYSIQKANSGNNNWSISNYKNAIETIKSCREQLIDAVNDYCPFLMTRKSHDLLYLEDFLGKLWNKICPTETYIMFYDDEDSLKQSMDETQAIIQEQQDELTKIYNFFFIKKK